MRELGAEVISIGTEPDGYNINHECGSTHPKRAQEEVIKQRADFGIAIDGDGSVLTNFGTLPTIANNPADNFILLIIDNGSYGSTGDQPTYAGMKTSLAKVAEACGCDNVVECSAEDTAAAVKTALDGDKMTIIVSKCDSGNIKVPVIDMDAPVIRHRFMAEVSRRNA